MTDEEYLSKPCVNCRAEGRTQTNLECIVEVAKTTGTPLDQAIREFMPRPELQQVPDKYVYHSKNYEVGNWYGGDA